MNYKLRPHAASAHQPSRAFNPLANLHFGAMDAKQNSPLVQQSLTGVPNAQFRVLIVGRANAGKTSILQRVCDTTENPEIYRRQWGTSKRVCSLSNDTFNLIV
jgi:hypothetical protein